MRRPFVVLAFSVCGGCAQTLPEVPPVGEDGGDDTPLGGETPDASRGAADAPGGGGPRPDAPTNAGGADAAAPHDCAAAASYGSLPRQSAMWTFDPSGLPYFIMTSELDVGGGSEDFLEVSLWAGLGPFAHGDVAPGTYTVGSDIVSCGVCVTIYGDVPPGGGDVRQLYHAQSGTVRVDALDFVMAGQITDVVLKQIDPATMALIPGGCETRIASASFETALYGP